MRKITAIIPARGGSKGVPNKNIKNLAGLPLVAYSIIACQKCELIDRIIVSTDDERIAKIAESHGAEIPFLRPPHLAQDDSTDWDVINHFFEEIDDNCVAYMRPTTPRRNPKNISEAISFFWENESKMSGLRSMHELPEPPYKMFKIEDGFCKGFFDHYNGIVDYTNLPRQTFPKAYQPNGYIDIAKRETVENKKTAFGMDVMPYITECITEVDTEYEFKLLEYQFSSDSRLRSETSDKN